MKAVAVFPRTREVKLIDADEPRITQPTQVKFRIMEVGVCDIDVSICAFERGTPPPDADSLIIGHEAVGTVVEIGSRVNSLVPGDLVVTTVRRACSDADCRPCRSGHPDFCISGGYAECGIKDHHGFLAEFAVEDEKYLQVIPHGLREVAVLVEPLTVAEKALSQGWHLLQRLPWMPNGRASEGTARGLRALVVGTGTSVVLGAIPLLRAGFETYVYPWTPLPNELLRMLEVFGVKCLSSAAAPSTAVDAFQGRIDVIYDAGGEAPDTDELLKLLAFSGIYLLARRPGEATPRSDLDHGPTRGMVLKNQLMLGVESTGKNAYTAAVRDLDAFAERWPKEVRSLITRRYPIDDFRDWLQGVAAGTPAYKNVITFDRAAAA